MLYRDFTFAQLKQRFGLVQQSIYLFEDENIAPFTVSERLREDLQEAERMPLYSEKAKSEMLIAPVIKEIVRRNPHISLFSGYSFNIDIAQGLNGEPDFIIAAKPSIVEIKAPVFCLMESKNKAAEEGFAQCAAEMYGARLFNQRMEEPYETIYGVVTNAYEWIFMKLHEKQVFIDIRRYYLNELPNLLGIMQFIVNQYKK